ncbi:hypothetical protein AJ80_01038 [Polytolypa hystricis UAMH7299]|uniref:tRNA (adenine(58)-N(1))-methyltransferase catalytic subunit TRM61 n=1 Tax=Polytolypa hystricis (strain UAMH7299) TaxID=1447883 RepID=A0A2B7Z2H3_POLH7|nr:hypothetical protein AJ80_01038 [Polytolypa hystricis UAMH7299]
MAKFFSFLSRFLHRPPAVSHGRSIDTNLSIFREGDRVFVHGKNPLLTKPLRANDQTSARRGLLKHNDIIGKRSRDLVQAYKGPMYRVTYPTLEEYVTLTPRLVTPVYAPDANLIVSLLDLHTFPPSSDGKEDEPLEILEAGTGHGSLTLHLSRAINAANTRPPPIPEAPQRQILTDTPPTSKSSRPKNESAKDKAAVDNGQQRDWDVWRGQRRAIIHTVEVSPAHSAHAESIVRGFRRGIYAGNVDFYVSSVENWVKEQINRRHKYLFSGTVKPFLSYAILDMPSAQLHIPHVASVLKYDGLLVVFMPNVTQIGDCVEIIQKQRLPLVMDKAVELGMGISSGRLWNIKSTVPKRHSINMASEEKEISKNESEEDTSDDTYCEGVPSAEGATEQESVLVCRPKVGGRIVGGGFVGIWRKIKE